MKKEISFKHFFADMENPLQDIATSVCVWQATEQYFRVDWVKPKRISQNCHTKASEAEASVDVFSLLNICSRGHRASEILQVALLTTKEKENDTKFQCGEKQGKVDNSSEPPESL